MNCLVEKKFFNKRLKSKSANHKPTEKFEFLLRIIYYLDNHTSNSDK